MTLLNHLSRWLCLTGKQYATVDVQTSAKYQPIYKRGAVVVVRRFNFLGMTSERAIRHFREPSEAKLHAIYLNGLPGNIY